MSSLLHLEDVGKFLLKDHKSNYGKQFQDFVDVSTNFFSKVKLNGKKSSDISYILSDQCLAKLADKLDSHEVYCSHSSLEDLNNGDFKDSKNDVNYQGTSRNVATITDVCSSSDIAEVEIISLLEEQIPKYKLRADSLTQFSGYENEDWFIGNPALPPDENLDLTDEQVGETLDYFVLCSERLSQMTKTYNDIDAVTGLLAEKEKDLELAARIGQSLLSHKNDLQLKNKQLEAELASANDELYKLHEEVHLATNTVTKLRHDLSIKSGLLQIYTQDLDNSESSSAENTPLQENPSKFSNWNSINERVRVLEDENRKLKEETADLHCETANLEAKENQLVSECVKELSESSFQVRSLAEELAKKAEDNARQQEEITNFLSKIVELQKKIRMTCAQNEELESHLLAAQETERELTEELIDLKDKYEEVMEMLHETQEELKKYHKKETPHVRALQCGSSGVYNNCNSLAYEIESCFSHDSDFGDSYSSDDKKSHSNRVFDTVRRAHIRRNTANKESSASTPAHRYKSRPNRTTQKKQNDQHGSDSESVFTDESFSTYVSEKNLTAPSELESALTKLSLRRRTEHEYQKLKYEKRDDDSIACGGFTPDSIMSTGNSFSFYKTRKNFKYPSKLQIVKPFEGSSTLLQWRNLATPHLGGLADSARPGVKIKSEIQTQEPNEMYSIYDCEEEDGNNFPGRGFVDTSSVFTYTVSTVMHPSNDQILTSSVPTTQISTTSALPATACSAVLSSKQTADPEKSINNDRFRSGTSTISINSGLSKFLQERPSDGAITENKSYGVLTKSSNSNDSSANQCTNLLSNTINYLRMTIKADYDISGNTGMKKEFTDNERVGLGLLSTSATPRSVYTRTMINSNMSDKNSPCSVDKSQLKLDLKTQPSTQLTCINPSNIQECSPTIGTLKNFATMRKGGLFS